MSVNSVKKPNSKARVLLLTIFGICFLGGCSNAQHQANVDILNTDYCTNNVIEHCRHVAPWALTLDTSNDAFDEQLKPIHQRQDVIEQELEILRRH
jgi:hypothetical protein